MESQLQDRLLVVNTRIARLQGKPDRSAEDNKSLAAAHAEAEGLERQLASAAATDAGVLIEEVPNDAQAREIASLRHRVNVSAYLDAGIRGARLDGAEEELRVAAGSAERSIPLAAFPPSRRSRMGADTATGIPAITGRTFAPVVPAAFSESIAERIGIAMPRVPSGRYAVPRLTTSLTGGTKAKGAAAESSAAAFTVADAGPKRISTRLTLRIEDLAEAGIPAFESSLRQNLQLVLAQLLDDQLIAGDGNGANLNGLMAQLTADTNPSNAATFQSIATDVAAQIDGLFATRLSDVRLVVNPATYARLAALFQSAASYAGEFSALDWMARAGIECWTNSRMPAGASNISKVICIRASQMAEPSGVAAMPAVAPVWGDIAIDDPYTDSASGTRNVSLHLLVGDVIVRQPEAFAEMRVKTA